MANYTSEERVMLSGFLLIVKKFGEALDDADAASRKVLAGESGETEFKSFIEKTVECTGDSSIKEKLFDLSDVIPEDLDFIRKTKAACKAFEICIEKRLA